MTFKTHNKSHGRSMGEAISVTNDGAHIFIGKAIRDKFPPDPVFATYHVDEKNNRIGIKIVKRVGKAAKFYKFNRESSMFSCKAFVAHFNSLIKKGKRYPAKWDARRKMIVVKLKVTR